MQICFIRIFFSNSQTEDSSEFFPIRVTVFCSFFPPTLLFPASPHQRVGNPLFIGARLDQLRHIHDHTAENLADEIFCCLKKFARENKLHAITGDNASSNIKMTS